jgi:uncharacterized coiled-coil protein SlyX
MQCQLASPTNPSPREFILFSASTPDSNNPIIYYSSNNIMKLPFLSLLLLSQLPGSANSTPEPNSLTPGEQAGVFFVSSAAAAIGAALVVHLTTKRLKAVKNRASIGPPPTTPPLTASKPGSSGTDLGGVTTMETPNEYVYKVGEKIATLKDLPDKSSLHLDITGIMEKELLTASKDISGDVRGVRLVQYQTLVQSSASNLKRHQDELGMTKEKFAMSPLSNAELVNSVRTGIDSASDDDWKKLENRFTAQEKVFTMMSDKLVEQQKKQQESKTDAKGAIEENQGLSTRSVKAQAKASVPKPADFVVKMA